MRGTRWAMRMVLAAFLIGIAIPVGAATAGESKKTRSRTKAKVERKASPKDKKQAEARKADRKNDKKSVAQKSSRRESSRKEASRTTVKVEKKQTTPSKSARQERSRSNREPAKAQASGQGGHARSDGHAKAGDNYRKPTVKRPGRWHTNVVHRGGTVCYEPRCWYPPPPPPRHVNHYRPPGWRPWHRRASCVYVGTQPFYFHTGFGVYFGGLALEFTVGNYPPAGFAYYDPYCGAAFWSLDAYYEHVGWCGHPAFLTLTDARYVDATFAVGVHGPGFSLRIGF